MKKFLIGLLVVASTLSLVVTDAQARRMGGGSSFGRQSQSVTRQARAPSPSQATNTAKPAPAATPQGVTPKPASPWRGMLGGALLGLGLGALLSHFGLGGAMAGMISTLLMVALLAAAAMFIFRMLKRRNGDAAQPGSMRPAYAGLPEIGSRIEPSQRAALQPDATAFAHDVAPSAPWGVPADFDANAFLRQAKTHFIRLQAVWDKADVHDLREFTTPEMFAEMRLELQARGASPNHTDVVSLDAELLGIETSGDEYLASVRFSGMIREDEQAAAAPFVEVWNLSKPVQGQGGWVLAGIQQLSQ
jgi:predicted lipid-binding transport protein (Tim44 family)